MIKITLPNGNIKEFEKPINGFELAESIAKSLAKSAIVMKVNGELVDLSEVITKDCEVTIVTGSDPEGLDIIRHDAAHILAEALKELYPKIQITIGPSIENGFYYDVLNDVPITLDDLEIIERKMYEIVKRNDPFIRHIWSREEAIKYFKEHGEHYKVEIIESIPTDQPLSFYKQGNFIDLCRGPHTPSTGKITAFKLTKLAGAYWRGDSKNQMLQRIYGTAWNSKAELDHYLEILKEAELRDHRKLGKELELFHLQEEAPGMIFWHPNGWTIYRIIENYIREKISKENYIEVKTPVLVEKSLWEDSGHWEKFGHAMFTSGSEDKIMALKPMNCPCHVQIFNQGLKSYRDLPIKMAEFGTCHRNEPSGSLHGIMRVRGFVQDDAHIFCSEDMITHETIEFCRLLKEVYKDFGFTDIKVKFSDRPEVRAGSDETWDKAEKSLKEAIEAAGLEYSLNPGEGAFYGPKIEFVLRDTIGRDWQCGTLQVDFVLPARLNASYIGSDGNKHIPVMLHRAIVGSLERFIGILIEHHAGKFPLWLAPIQVAIVTITDEANSYANEIKKRLDMIGIRSRLDISSEKINYKIRQYSIKKIPLIFAVGKKEMEQNTVSIRRMGSDQQQIIHLEEVLANLPSEVALPK